MRALLIFAAVSLLAQDAAVPKVSEVDKLQLQLVDKDYQIADLKFKVMQLVVQLNQKELTEYRAQLLQSTAELGDRIKALHTKYKVDSAKFTFNTQTGTFVPTTK